MLTPPRLSSLIVAQAVLLTPAFGALATLGDSMELYKDPKAPVEKRVEDLLGLLTAAEKLEMLAYLDPAGMVGWPVVAALADGIG